MRIVVTVAASYWILVELRGVLQPVVIALLVWLVLTATSSTIVKLLPEGMRRISPVATLFTAAATLLILFILGVLIANDVATLSNNLTAYEDNLDRWLSSLGALFGLDNELSVVGLLARVDFRRIALNFAGSTAGYLAVFFAVVIYLLFILLEASSVSKKVEALAQDSVAEAKIRGFLATIKRAIDDFLFVQVLVGLIQAVPTFLLLKIVGVDAPVLWAVLIFLLSFIPTIGTLFGILIPTAMAFFQFSSIVPILVVFGVLGVIQVVATNVILPQLMSKSLNLSPLIVLFAVFLGGTVWGIVGALIAVPALTILLIISAGLPHMRPLAVILSADGRLPTIPGAADDDSRPSATS